MTRLWMTAHSVTGLAALALMTSCGPTPGARHGAEGGAIVAGRITYDARQPTPTGASAEVTRRPARHVDVALIGADGQVAAEGQADEDGRFRIEGPADAQRLRVFARVRVRGHDVAVARDAGGRETHAVEVELEDPTAPIVVHTTDATGDGGAFHVLDSLLTGLDAVTAWTGRSLPPLFTYWVRGGTREWSFYRGERPEGSGRFALELLGGDPGEASVSDTDEHDEAIILHELGHFVMDRLSSDSSTGGMHPTGARIDPGLAWEEGRATWFALAVLGVPLYRDTIGVEPWGRLRVDEDLEGGGGPHTVAGLGSETSVARVLWDLTDGGDGPPDTDEDGLAIGAAPILEAMITQAAEPGAFPSLPSFLRFLVARGLVERDALVAMLGRTGQPADELLPETDAATWPTPATVSSVFDRTLDGLSQPAPSGGPNLPQTGFDAIHTYRVHVEETGMLVARLVIQGSGRVADRTDLDLELLDLRADRLADSRTEAAQEIVSHLVSPGHYIVRVRDGGQGNRAAYRLTIALETL